MIGSFRNFAKTKFAGILVFIMIIPFVFWGMGSMFSSGNTNNIAKINKTNISTQEFIDYLNNSKIPQDYIRDNLKNNIIQEILSGLVSSTLLDLEIEDFNIIVSEKTLLKKIKTNKNFFNDLGNFERTKYEKFLLENSYSATGFEGRLKKRELQRLLFDYIGAGTIAPKFLVKKLYEEENKTLEIEFINLNNYYKRKEDITDKDLVKFLSDNKEQLKIEYLDFNYTIINPKNLIGVDEFNQTFFDKIDQIEIDISNEIPFETIVSNLNLEMISVENFKSSSEKDKIEKKIFELKNNNFDIFEIDDDYVLFKINSIQKKEPDLNDDQTKKEILELVEQKNKFDFNKELLKKIKDKNFINADFQKMGKDNIQTIQLNSIKDNKKFDINAVEILYSLPVNALTLINDEQNNIYIARVKKFENKINDNNLLEKYNDKQNSIIRNSMLKSYDLFLNNKYKVVYNQKTIERVNNFFQ